MALLLHQQAPSAQSLPSSQPATVSPRQARAPSPSPARRQHLLPVSVALTPPGASREGIAKNLSLWAWPFPSTPHAWSPGVCQCRRQASRKVGAIPGSARRPRPPSRGSDGSWKGDVSSHACAWFSLSILSVVGKRPVGRRGSPVRPGGLARAPGPTQPVPVPGEEVRVPAGVLPRAPPPWQGACIPPRARATADAR